MDKIHIWIGLFLKSEHEYWNYFDQSKAYAFDENGRERNETERQYSQFSKDIGEPTMYDPDFIGIYYNGTSNDLDLAIEATPDSGLYESIKEHCLEMGIESANAMFYYTDSELTLTRPERKYNELTYIGCFDW